MLLVICPVCLTCACACISLAACSAMHSAVCCSAVPSRPVPPASAASARASRCCCFAAARRRSSLSPCLLLPTMRPFVCPTHHPPSSPAGVPPSRVLLSRAVALASRARVVPSFSLPRRSRSSAPVSSMRPCFMRSSTLACFCLLCRVCSSPPSCHPSTVPLVSRAHASSPRCRDCPPRPVFLSASMRPCSMRPSCFHHLLPFSAASPVPIDCVRRPARCLRALPGSGWCCPCTLFSCLCSCVMRPCFMRLFSPCVLSVLRMSAVPPGLSAGPCPSLRPL